MRPLATWLPGYLVPVLLASCGYSPLYVPNAGDTAASAQVRVGEVTMDKTARNLGERRVAQTVSQRLQLDYPARAEGLDTLKVNIEESTSALATQRTAALQRAQINLLGNIEITDAQGKTVLRTSLSTSSAYNVESSPYSTETGKSYARLTAARNLAEDISTRVALFYKTRKTNPVEPMPAVAAPVSSTEVSFSIPLPMEKVL